jgi:hypothetical protein
MRSLSLLCIATFAATACAPTHVRTDFQQSGPHARPMRVYVYDFAVSADQVQLDRGIRSRLQQALSGKPPTEQQMVVGRSAARVISEELVARITAMGLPAERVTGAPGQWPDALVIEGQLTSVDQGNKTRQRLIGLGAGHSDVQAEVQVLATAPAGLEQLAAFTTDARSGFKPGAAVTMGAGAATGAIAASAAVNVAGASGISDQLSADVSADARRMAGAVADELQAYFAQQGWVTPR